MVAKGSIYYTKGYRDIILDIPGPNRILHSLKLIKIQLVPEIISNLLSVSNLNQIGYIILFVGNQGYIYIDNANYRSKTLLATIILRNKQYQLYIADISKGQLKHLIYTNQLIISTAISLAKSPALILVNLAYYRVYYSSKRKVKYIPYYSTRITLIKGSLSRPYSLYI